ncbi:MAG: FkbM family methyltransferase [Bacteroidota bacterium]
MLIKTKNQQYGFDFYYDSNDDFVGKQIAAANYEPYESKLFLENLKPNSILFDVGANIGYYSLLASSKILDGEIISFEPYLPIFEVLNENIKLNNIRNVHTYNTAIANYKGSSKLFLASDNQGDHRLYHTPGRNHVDVPVISIDLFIAESQIVPTIIKIDTQGFDYYVLLGLENLLQSSGELIIFTEFWIYGNIQSGVDSIRYFDFLRYHFSDIRYIDESTNTSYEVDFDFIKNECLKYNNFNHVNLFCKKLSQ